jgi:hypothetical protein
MADPRDLLGNYQELLRDLRRHSGPLAPLMSPLQIMADTLEQALSRQSEMEQQINAIVEPLAAAASMARDAPKLLRTQAQAFEAASVSFKQAADLMNLQADVLERTTSAMTLPAALLQRMRPPQNPPADES